MITGYKTSGQMGKENKKRVNAEAFLKTGSMWRPGQLHPLPQVTRPD